MALERAEPIIVLINMPSSLEANLVVRLKSMSLWLDVHNHFKSADITGAETLLEKFIAERNSQMFACLIGASFSNSHAATLAEINRFAETCSAAFDVKSIYLEMNGFDINYHRWYFDLFAYDSYSPIFDDTGWLCEWKSAPWQQIDLTGMENAQRAFSWYHEQQIWDLQPELTPIYEASMLLVVVKFAAFVASTLKAGELNRSIPILATAHGFESIARYEP